METDVRLRIRLLGGFEIEHTGARVRLETVKTEALLAYLALLPGRHPRLKLVGLLWGGLLESRGARNLRRALWDLRRHLASAEEAVQLVATRVTVELVPQPGLWVDADQFQRSCAGAGPAGEIAALTEAVDLYRGDLLDGLFIEDAPGFEDWLTMQRGRFRDLAETALARLTLLHRQRGSYELGLLCARRLLAINPWQESAHRTLMEMLVLAGQPGAALSHFETCRRVLADELHTTPSQETTALFERIRAGAMEEREQDGSFTPSQFSAGHSLPIPPTPFIGRDDELAGIDRLLADPSCRLLTLSGPGGIGKTRLALEAAAREAAHPPGGPFPDHVFYAPLEGLESHQHLAAALSDALRLTAFAPGSARAHLLDFLRGKRLLLVLDNFEHLSEGLELLAEILTVSQGVKLLVTSRERVRLNGEWVLEVGGLKVPEMSAAEGAAETDSVRLFEQTARRSRLGFTLSGEELPHVVRICRLLDGMPLGIELAAAWVRALPAQTIAEEVEASLDFLETTQADIPPRQRSLRAIFEYSWDRSSLREREVFASLSLFRGGFRLDAARAVTGVSPGTLACLVDKSLLRHDSAGRYHQHVVLRGYAAAELARDAARSLRLGGQHAQFYATFLRSREEALHGSTQTQALAEIDEDIENVRASWEWGCEHAEATVIEGALESLVTYHDVRGRFQDGVRLIDCSLQVFVDPALIGRLLTARGGFLCRLGLYADAELALQAALPHLSGPAGRPSRVTALIHSGDALCAQGKYLEARSPLEEGLDIANDLGDRRGTARAFDGLGQVALDIGEHSEAVRLFSESLAIKRERGDRLGAAASLNSLGSIAHDSGDYLGARRFYRESLDIRRNVGDRRGIAISLNNLGLIAHRLGEYDEAERSYLESLAIKRDMGYRLGVAITLDNLGNLACERGDHESALRWLREGLETALSIAAEPMVLEILVSWAVLISKQGDSPGAAALLSAALNHPASEKWTRERARRLLSAVETSPAPINDALVSPQTWPADLTQLAYALVRRSGPGAH
ncbi:MAG: tetratricopeptide repeat protein [Acidobacteria bacterium]|nr:tetratricopeptide repeat protein [Acidobacteriota bacterium]